MSQRLPAVTARQVIRARERAGFLEIRSKGSPRIFGHPDRPEARVTVPDHGYRNLRTGTFVEILKQADTTIEKVLSLI